MLIEMKDIIKTYGNVVANNKVNIGLNKQEILAIVGENGAGKSTIMKILYGLERFDGGEIFVKGVKSNIVNPTKAISLGIGMVQQHFMLFDVMSVTENIIYGHEVRKGIFLDKKQADVAIDKLSKKYGLPVNPQTKINELPIGLQQRVEILKVLYQESEIIIFDEPTAVLTPLESEELLKTLKKLKQSGKSIILITHKLQEVMDVADRVVVMRHGEVVFETKTTDTNIDELTTYMVGHQIVQKEILAHEFGEIKLAVNDLTIFVNTTKPVLSDINFDVKEGEIVGIAGVSGNGQSELIKAITGLLKIDKGKIVVNGKDVTNSPVHVIREAGLSHVPEDRYLWGSALEATLIENSLMSYQDKKSFNSKGILNKKEIKKFAEKLIKTFSVKADNSNQKIKELSGGNAQKLIVARELTSDSKVLIISEPTRGIDVGASDFIHNKILEKRKNNHAILLMSSNLTEIMNLCDRIHVLFEGKINKSFIRNEADAKTIGLYMVKGESDDEKE